METITNASFQLPLTVRALPLKEKPLCPGFYFPTYVQGPQLLADLLKTRYIGAFLWKDDTNQALINVLKGKELLNQLHEIGSLAQISRIPGHQVTIIVTGLVRIRITEMVSEDPLTVKFEYLKEKPYDKDDHVIKETTFLQVSSVLGDVRNHCVFTFVPEADREPVLYEHTPIGVAMALSRTSKGGSASYMRASIIEEGKGRRGLYLMGQVGKEMKDSAFVAYMAAQEILLQKQPENTFFANSMLRLDLPTGNGISAGCTMTTSFLSLAMKKPVRKNLAMTGTIIPSGKILGIGAVKEKTVGARQSQVKTMIFPEANRRDFDELAQNLKEGIDVHFVHEYEQVFELAFGYGH